MTLRCQFQNLRPALQTLPLGPEQQETLVAIARGQAGGPMEPMLALTTEFLGVELRPIEFRKNGMKWSVSIPDLVDQEAEGVPSPVSIKRMVERIGACCI